MLRQPSKIERTGPDYFCAVNVLQLAAPSNTDVPVHRTLSMMDGRGGEGGGGSRRTDEPDEPPPVTLTCCFISMFVFRRCQDASDQDTGAKSHADTIITICEDDPDAAGAQVSTHHHI